MIELNDVFPFSFTNQPFAARLTHLPADLRRLHPEPPGRPGPGGAKTTWPRACGPGSSRCETEVAARYLGVRTPTWRSRCRSRAASRRGSSSGWPRTATGWAAASSLEVSDAQNTRHARRRRLRERRVRISQGRRGARARGRPPTALKEDRSCHVVPSRTLGLAIVVARRRRPLRPDRGQEGQPGHRGPARAGGAARPGRRGHGQRQDRGGDQGRRQRRHHRPHHPDRGEGRRPGQEGPVPDPDRPGPVPVGGQPARGAGGVEPRPRWSRPSTNRDQAKRQR